MFIKAYLLLKLYLLGLANLQFPVAFILDLLPYALFIYALARFRFQRRDIVYYVLFLVMGLIIYNSENWFFEMGSVSAKQEGYSHLKMYILWFMLGVGKRQRPSTLELRKSNIFWLLSICGFLCLNWTMTQVHGKAFNYLQIIDEFMFFGLISIKAQSSKLKLLLLSIISGSRSAAISLIVTFGSTYVVFVLVIFVLMFPLYTLIPSAFLERVLFLRGLQDSSFVHRIFLLADGMKSLAINFWETQLFFHLRQYDTLTLYIHNFLSYAQVWGAFPGLIILSVVSTSMWRLRRTDNFLFVYVVLNLLFFRSYVWHVLWGFVAYSKRSN